MSKDVEKGRSRTQPAGFPSLSSYISSDKDFSTVIYRRFDRVSARNILYLQSELAELEKKQDEMDREDYFDGTTVTHEIARDWTSFEKAAQQRGSKARKKMRLVKEIRAKLKEYKEAVLLDVEMISLRQPSRQSFKAFQKTFMNDADGGQLYPTLGGASSSLYETRDDVVGLASPKEEDRLTKFLRKYFFLLFLERHPDHNSRVVYISSKRISTVVGLINILLAASFLFGAIYNLYSVHSDQVKLGLIAGYTTGFAVCISFVTNARRSEIFGACAAYAAVLVVFVSGDLGGSVSSRSPSGTTQPT